MSDLISRQDAIYALVEKGQSSKRYKFGEFWELNLSEIKEALDSLPSAEPERTKGEWVKDEYTYSGPNTYNYVCSVCGAIGGSWLRKLPKNLMYPFCPFCGSDMRGE